MLRSSAMQSVALMVALQGSYIVTLYCEQIPTMVLLRVWELH